MAFVGVCCTIVNFIVLRMDTQSISESLAQNIKVFDQLEIFEPFYHLLKAWRLANITGLL